MAANERVLGLMKAAADLVAPIGLPDDVKRHDLEVLALFDRCRSLHGGVRLLLAHGFVHEAVMLGRPLFIDSLALAEFAAADEKRRGSLAVGWMLASLQHLDGLFLDRRSRGDDVATERENVSAQRREVERYAARHGYSTKHWEPDDDPKGLADRHGRGDEYAALLVTHMFVHGATTVTGERYSRAEDDTVEVGGPAARHEPWERDAGLFASYSLLHAARATCTIFGWPEPPELDPLLKTLLDEAGRQGG